MVDVKPWTHAEHVNPMPHGGFDVAHHIPILNHPTKEPTHAVSPCARASPQAYGNGVTSAYPFGRTVSAEGCARLVYAPSSSSSALASWRSAVSKPSVNLPRSIYSSVSKVEAGVHEQEKASKR